MKLNRTNLVSRLTNFVGLAVLVFEVVFLIWAAVLIQQATGAVKTATMVSNTYQQVVYTLTKEEAFQYEYALNPSIAVRDEYLAAARTVSNLVQGLQPYSDAGDNPIGQKILTQQATYLFYNGPFFSAIDAKDFVRANAILSSEVDPLLNQIGDELDRQTKIEAAESVQALAQLTQVQQTIFVAGPILLIIGLLLLGITMRVAGSYRRKLDE